AFDFSQLVAHAEPVPPLRPADARSLRVASCTRSRWGSTSQSTARPASRVRARGLHEDAAPAQATWPSFAIARATLFQRILWGTASAASGLWPNRARELAAFRRTGRVDALASSGIAPGTFWKEIANAQDESSPDAGQSVARSKVVTT